MNWRIFFSVVAVASLLAYALHLWLHVNFWSLLLLILGSLKLNGMVADWEDWQPGGFLGPPPGDKKPPHKKVFGTDKKVFGRGRTNDHL